VGRCGYLWQVVEGRPELEIGYLLGRKHWGRGLATEAATALRDHAFREMKTDRVISLIQPANERSRRVAERNGMRVSGETLHAGLPHLVYAITFDEWRSLAAGREG